MGITLHIEHNKLIMDIANNRRYGIGGFKMCSKAGLVSVVRMYLGSIVLQFRAVSGNEDLSFVDAGNFESTCRF